MAKENFNTLLGKLEDYWIQSRAPILNKLNPGLLQRKDIVSRFTGTLPKEVWELYQWKNGLKPEIGDTIGNLSILRLGIFLTFESAQQIQIEMADDEYGWDSSKFILFESGGGDYYLIEGDVHSPFYGQIFLHSISSPEFNRIITIYDSLYKLFLTIYECFLNKIFEYQGGKLKFGDYNKEIKLAASLNPRSDYWRLGKS